MVKCIPGVIIHRFYTYKLCFAFYQQKMVKIVRLEIWAHFFIPFHANTGGYPLPAGYKEKQQLKSVEKILSNVFQV